MPTNSAALASLSLREVSALYLVPFVVLVVILVERELLRAVGGARTRAAGRVLDLAGVPLLAAFAILVLLRLDYIF